MYFVTMNKNNEVIRFLTYIQDKECLEKHHLMKWLYKKSNFN